MRKGSTLVMTANEMMNGLRGWLLLGTGVMVSVIGVLALPRVVDVDQPALAGAGPPERSLKASLAYVEAPASISIEDLRSKYRHAITRAGKRDRVEALAAFGELRRMSEKISRE